MGYSSLSTSRGAGNIVSHEFLELAMRISIDTYLPREGTETRTLLNLSLVQSCLYRCLSASRGVGNSNTTEQASVTKV